MNILEVAKGLEAGRVYRQKNWAPGFYLCIDSYKNMKMVDGRHVKDFEVTTTELLSTEWEECKKDTWYLIEVDRELGLYNDNVYVTYILSQEKEDYDPWCCLKLKLEEIETYKQYLHIELAEESLNKVDKEELQTILAK